MESVKIDSARDAAALEELRTQLVGRKSGRLTHLMKQLPTLPAEQRREAGAALNEVRSQVEARLAAASADRSTATTTTVDLTMPARRQWKGGRHPVTVVIDEIEGIFRELGFTAPIMDELREVAEELERVVSVGPLTSR